METDVEFFSELKKAYLGNRGILRTCFSMWRYDHCEFFRFHKYGIDQSEPVRVDFPLDADLTYDFTPRPIDFRPPSGPIPKSQFHAHFYNPHSNNRTWRSFCLDRIAPELLKNEHLKSLPKRRQVIVQDSKREIFWGIYAREKRCFGWVLTYGVVCNFPGLLFFFLWIFEWQHASDLQNASVPVQLSLSLTICYAALLYESRERL
ncbi:uncharacterized protein K489DRAFT_328756 [Dissoconium aciculare CBS 342.82]|uniref:Uncharacterized protein n=1 Tax=Dissoconium aciculare CBS 342.82 TaxID=1314786 RepID=A0A6J3LT72_9PEZI|nr:uncharacterized protein K489DRAFT_328756 [Dissoconium aciculare CBS 342.82]KAF1817812.1 hypothetical protein K489DRAFT_328756 [Dissoconium aciculare CBS 342.82]